MRSERKFDNEEIPHSTPDKDNDGLQDAEEEYGWTVKRDINGDGDTDDTDETILPAGKTGDLENGIWSNWTTNNTDSDELNDFEEKDNGTNPQYRDTDGDKIWDYEEVTVYATNPLKVDTDMDGWNDGEEIKKYKTNPNDWDTDGDGVLDCEDIDPLQELKLDIYINAHALEYEEPADGGMPDIYFILYYYSDRDINYFGRIITEPTPNREEIVSARISVEIPQKKIVSSSLYFTLFMFDSDTHDVELDNSDDPFDINPASGDWALHISYNATNGTWSGDDRLKDSDGYGHSLGNGDYPNGELYFDIKESDVDGDKIPYWKEIDLTELPDSKLKKYKWDPSVCDWDEDADGLPDYYEIKYTGGVSNTMYIGGGDCDYDELSDYDEYILQTNPIHKNEKMDLFYRVVNVNDTGMETKVDEITKEERFMFDNYPSLSEVNPAGPIHYPAVGHPALLSWDSLDFDIYIDTSNSAWIGEIINISDSSKRYSLTIDDAQSDSVSGLMKATACVSGTSSPEPGLYSLRILINGQEHTVPHAVQIYKEFKENFTFVHITDVHIGGKNEGEGTLPAEPFGTNGQVGDFLAIINRINKVEKPDFVVITGDLTDFGTEIQMKYFKACLLKLNVPVFVTPGNHDYGEAQAVALGISLVPDELTESLLLSIVGGLIWCFSGMPPEWADSIAYGKYINPWFPTEVNSKISWGYDYSFDYGDHHFIMFDSGWSTNTEKPPTMSGLTSEQLAWMKEDQKQAYTNGKTHTFIFTHAPIVGHGGEETHQDTDGDHDRPFVEWVNGDDSDYIEGIHVEAVFVGHTHENHIFYDVSTNPNSDKYMDHPPEYSGVSLDFGVSTFYIETTTATKNG